MGVTVVLSGMPHYVSTEDKVTLNDLAYNLDNLFDTDEIGTFRLRDLDNHNRSCKRQIALDFNSGFDAILAQQKLDGFMYMVPSGNEYILKAKVTNDRLLMCDSPEKYEQCNRSYQSRDRESQHRSVVPKYSNELVHYAHDKLEDQLSLLRKQKMVIDAERALLQSRRKLAREEKNIGCSESDSDDQKQIKPKKRRRYRSSSMSSDSSALGSPHSSKCRKITYSRETSRAKTEMNKYLKQYCKKYASTTIQDRKLNKRQENDSSSEIPKHIEKTITVSRTAKDRLNTPSTREPYDRSSPCDKRSPCERRTRNDSRSPARSPQNVDKSSSIKRSSNNPKTFNWESPYKGRYDQSNSRRSPIRRYSPPRKEEARSKRKCSPGRRSTSRQISPVLGTSKSSSGRKLVDKPNKGHERKPAPKYSKDKEMEDLFRLNIKTLKTDLLREMEATLAKINMNSTNKLSDTDNKLIVSQLKDNINSRFNVLNCKPHESMKHVADMYRNNHSAADDESLIRKLFDEIAMFNINFQPGDKLGLISNKTNEDIAEDNENIWNAVDEVLQDMPADTLANDSNTPKTGSNKDDDDVLETITTAGYKKSLKSKNTSIKASSVIVIEKSNCPSLLAEENYNVNNATPNFTIALSNIMETMENSINCLKIPYYKTFSFNKFLLRVLRRRFEMLLKGKSYRKTSEICQLYRLAHPESDDDNFLKNVYEKFNNGDFNNDKDSEQEQDKVVTEILEGSVNEIEMNKNCKNTVNCDITNTKLSRTGDEIEASREADQSVLLAKTAEGVGGLPLICHTNDASKLQLESEQSSNAERKNYLRDAKPIKITFKENKLSSLLKQTKEPKKDVTGAAKQKENTADKDLKIKTKNERIKVQIKKASNTEINAKNKNVFIRKDKNVSKTNVIHKDVHLQVTKQELGKDNKEGAQHNMIGDIDQKYVKDMDESIESIELYIASMMKNK